MNMIMAFNTSLELNKLSEKQLVKKVRAISEIAGRVVVTEYFEGYKRSNGEIYTEYFYKFETFSNDKTVNEKLASLYHDWGVLNNQESIIINGELIDITGERAW